MLTPIPYPSTNGGTVPRLAAHVLATRERELVRRHAARGVGSAVVVVVECVRDTVGEGSKVVRGGEQGYGQGV
jgi:hypothetical protein